MHKLSLKYSMEFIVSLLTLVALLGVFQTFVVGKHFIIPTVILTLGIILGNLAAYGYRDQPWAKHMLFWFGVIFTLHAFFALFWAKAYRDLLGDAFEYLCVAIVAIMAVLTWQYARRNALFRHHAMSDIQNATVTRRPR
ncbi:MAG TPA: hypothetical protein VKZ91_15260 [Woeseiaceae bacterium]|nr:hypothetical protein [Woeseiaceae bacterium]